MVLAETVPEYSPIEDALNELGKDLHKQKMPTPSFHKFGNHGPQQNILTNCKTEFKRISTFVHLVLLTLVEIRSDPYTSVAQV